MKTFLHSSLFQQENAKNMKKKITIYWDLVQVARQMEGKLLKGLASCYVSADNINLSNLSNSNDKMLFFEASHHSTHFWR